MIREAQPNGCGCQRIEGIGQDAGDDLRAHAEANKSGVDGEQTAGLYKSRLARLEFRATVQNGAPANYYLVANGSRLTSAKNDLPTVADSCAAAKKMPKPDTASASCNGDRFSLIIAHAGNERYALLYGGEGAAWKYCGAGIF